MIFVDCPAYLDDGEAARCGLPAEVTCRYIVRSTDGSLESAMIRCPVGHWFNGPIGSLTWESTDNQTQVLPRPVPAPGGAACRAPVTAATVGTGSALRDYPAGPQRTGRRPNAAPA